ncbi:dynein heavy chain 1, axonemal-like [Pseudomyrmex gracilis]|uniref:dynein heavy chain 1, axonemal-like n=1 Tax=Pseudomyrmex gracilis TaxID=219809 RepID=UPI000995C57D|nr:dynein heavy chain 1, axonemal-like [Pseudomyrmex gracilis]
MLVGPTSSGKTKCYEILRHACTASLKGQLQPSSKPFTTVITYVLNPKAVTLGQLYSEYDLNTCECGFAITMDSFCCCLGIRCHLRLQKPLYIQRLAEKNTERRLHDGFTDPIDGSQEPIPPKWYKWLDGIPSVRITPDTKYADIEVPTMNSVRSVTLIEHLLINETNVLCIGPSGSGKTLTVSAKLSRNMPGKYICDFMTFSWRELQRIRRRISLTRNWTSDVRASTGRRF